MVEKGVRSIQVWLRNVRGGTFYFSATKPLTHRTTLSFEVVITNTNCADIEGTYTNNYLGLLNSFNLDLGSVLCHGTSCASILEDTFACQSSGKGTVNIDFGYIP